MPRDGSGVYTLPAGNPVVSNTVIASAWANSTMTDIAAQLNNVFTRDGLLGPTGPFKVVDGTVAAPGLAWNSEPGLGFYRPGAGVIGVAGGGRQKFVLDGSPADGAIFGIKANPASAGGALLTLDKGTNSAQAAIYGRRNGVLRWTMEFGNSSAETGAGNAGSDFVLARYTDAGAVIEQTFRIFRNSGQAYFAKPLSVGENTGQGFLVLNSIGTSGKDIIGTSAGLARWNLRVGSGTDDGGDDFVIYRYNDAGVQLGQVLRIARNTGNSTFQSGVVQLGANSSGAIYGGGTASELSMVSAGNASTGIVWPNTNGGYIGVRGNTNANYAVGAISCYSGSGNTGVTLTNGSTAWAALSDITMKDVVSEIEDGLDAVLAIRPIRYRYKFEAVDAPVRVGLSAQSVQTLIPEAVMSIPVMGEDGQVTSETRLNLAVTDVIPHVVDAIKTLHARVAALEAA